MNVRFLYLLFITAIFSFSLQSCSVKQKRKQKAKNQYINKTYQAVRKKFPEANVQIVCDSIKLIFPNNVVFDVGAANLKSSFEVKLIRFGDILKQFTETNLLITGHTDSTGDEKVNLSLSLSRAETVKDFLIKKDVKGDRLFIWGLGQRRPIATNTTEIGRMKNRRVEFVVLYEPKENK